MKMLALCTTLALALVPLAACDAPAPTLEPASPTGMVAHINTFVAAPQTVSFSRIDTSATTLQLAATIDRGSSWRLRVELTPDLRADGVQEVVEQWTGGKDVAIEWEGTFEHLTVEGDPVAIPVDAVGETVIDPHVRTLCGQSQRVRARAWVTIDGLRVRALITFGVVEVADKGIHSLTENGEGIYGPGNCQIQASWISGWTYSWCENTSGETNGTCTFVQQTTSSTAQVCLSGTVLGGVGSGSGITIGGGGGSGTATGTWGTVTNMVLATYTGNCIHVDGWFGDWCECRATGAPTYSTIPMGCAAGTGESCASPTSCPTGSGG